MLFRGLLIASMQSKIIFHVKLNLYTAWLVTVDRVASGLFFGPEAETPAPIPSVGTPPPPSEVGCICLCAGISIPEIGSRVRINTNLIKEYLASYLVL
jgi:hypothetical protein